jgi:hypothetical protein
MKDLVLSDRCLLVQIFSVLLTPRDLGRCALVCCEWKVAALDTEIWKTMCEQKFGLDVASQAVADEHYDGNWRDMLQDDCQRAANLSLYRGISCPWKYNGRDNLFYCCWIESIVWNRVADELHLYIDVRGEEDLRHPGKSMFQRRDFSGDSLGEVPVPGGNFTWISDIEKIIGHYKGKIIIPIAYLYDAVPTMTGFELQFQYSGYVGRGMRIIQFGVGLSNAFDDYITSNILTFPASSTPLKDAFRTAKYTLDISPFASDTPEIERQRWQRIFPDEILNRRVPVRTSRTRSTWWV